MDNNLPEGVKQDIKRNDKDSEEPSKLTIIEKLKKIRWTFKVKNNLLQSVSVEPLLCFYMLQIFMISLVEPHNFHKACVSVDRDTYFCDIVTHIGKKLEEPCAEYNNREFYCKIRKDNDRLQCNDQIWKYELGKSEATFISPENYRLCTVIKDTMKRLESEDDALIDIFAIVLKFLVVMIVSIWSDKYSKRKTCLLLPLIGQLAVTTVNLYGALNTNLSFEFIKTLVTFIDSFSGGIILLLYGCFTYMTNEKIRKSVLFRFGVLTLILTLYRLSPLYKLIYNFYHDDNAYLNLISITLVFNILCLVYVKVILNEIKSVPKLIDLGATSSNASSTLKTTEDTKFQKLVKALSLDVIWGYLQLIFKRRRDRLGRFIIILFVCIVFIQKASLADHRMSVKLGRVKISSIDIDGGIFVLISLLLIILKISEAVIAILLISLTALARLLIMSLSNCCGFYDLSTSQNAGDFYSPFKTITQCCILLCFIDKTETRIFLIVQAIAYLASFLCDLLLQSSRQVMTITTVFLSLLIFCGLGLLYFLVKKHMIDPTTVKHEVTERPWKFSRNENFNVDTDNGDVAIGIEKEKPIVSDVGNDRHVPETPKYEYIQNTHL